MPAFADRTGEYEEAVAGSAKHHFDRMLAYLPRAGCQAGDLVVQDASFFEIARLLFG
jgi:hypothetical protein